MLRSSCRKEELFSHECASAGIVRIGAVCWLGFREATSFLMANAYGLSWLVGPMGVAQHHAALELQKCQGRERVCRSEVESKTGCSSGVAEHCNGLEPWRGKLLDC